MTTESVSITESRQYRCTYQCTGTRKDRHQCQRTITGTSDDSPVLAEQSARDLAVARGWGVNGNDWLLAEAYGLRCPAHAGKETHQ